MEPSHANSLARRLRFHKQYNSALFEMVVARTLQVLGATLSVEPESTGGTRVDFLAAFPGGTVSVEAMAPVFNGQIGQECKARDQYLNFLDRKAPDGWSIRIWQLEVGEGGYGEFKRLINRWFKEVEHPIANSAPINFTTTWEDVERIGGVVEIQLIPKRYYSDRAVVSDSIVSFSDNTEERIRWAVSNPRKKRQARESEAPVLLAVKAPQAMSTANLREFDRALLGGVVPVGRLATEFGRKPWFQMDGEWTKGGDVGEPRVAGLLAFLGVEIAGGRDPLLYVHPRFEGCLPDEIQALEQRRFDWQSRSIVSIPPRTVGVMERIEWVQLARIIHGCDLE